MLRGGTALAKTYWPDYRLSEDLDLICPHDLPALQAWMHERVARAEFAAGAGIALDYSPPHDGRSRSFVRWAGQALTLDVVLDAPVVLPVQPRRLHLPYRIFEATVVTVPTTSLAEILGSIWRMLDDRTEPRDLFDLWWGLCRATVPFAAVAAGHQALYRFPPVRQFLSAAAGRLEAAWRERLEHQLSDLPAFGAVFRAVLEAYDGWDSAGKPLADTGSS